MLEAYLRERSLKEIDDRLPENAEQATEELGRFLEERPDDTRALFILARSQLLLEKTDAAKQTLETLLTHKPEHVSAAVEMAKVHIQDDELRKAIRLLTETTNARPEMAEVWGLLGRCLEKDGQTEAARDAMKQFAMVKAFNEKVVVAQKAFASGELQKAYVICRQLLNFLPNELRVLRLLAKIVRQLGHYEFSTSTLASCVETRPQLYLTFYTIRRMHFNVSGLRRFIFFNF